MTFIHPQQTSFCMHTTHTHTNTGNSALYRDRGTIMLFPGDLSVSATIIHHQALNMQMVLISVLGGSMTYSNVPLYLNSLSFIFISLIQCWPCSSITAGTHADRWSQGTVIGWSFCHSSLVYIFHCAEKGDTGLRNTLWYILCYKESHRHMLKPPKHQSMKVVKTAQAPWYCSFSEVHVSVRVWG